MSHPSRRSALRAATVLTSTGAAALVAATPAPAHGTARRPGGPGLLVGAPGVGGAVPSNRRKR